MQSRLFWVQVNQYVQIAFNSELSPPPLCTLLIKPKSATAVSGHKSSSALTSVQNNVIAKQLKQPEIQNGLKLSTQYSFYEE